MHQHCVPHLYSRCHHCTMLAHADYRPCILLWAFMKILCWFSVHWTSLSIEAATIHCELSNIWLTVSASSIGWAIFEVPVHWSYSISWLLTDIWWYMLIKTQYGFSVDEANPNYIFKEWCPAWNFFGFALLELHRVFLTVKCSSYTGSRWHHWHNSGATCWARDQPVKMLTVCWDVLT